jgi:anti-anti-sigma factor
MVRLVLVGKLWLPEEITDLVETIKRIADTGISVLIVDLSRLSFMCSLGLGVLVRMFAQLRDKNIQLVFLDPKEGIREMIELANITSVIRVISSEGELSAGPAPSNP